MAVWTLKSSEPFTTESRRLVVSDDGREGLAGVYRPGGGAIGGPAAGLFGAVYTEETDYDSEGTPVASRRTVIDPEPTFG